MSHLPRCDVTEVEELIESVVANMAIGRDVVCYPRDVNGARCFSVDLRKGFDMKDSDQENIFKEEECQPWASCIQTR